MWSRRSLPPPANELRAPWMVAPALSTEGRGLVGLFPAGRVGEGSGSWRIGGGARQNALSAHSIPGVLPVDNCQRR